MSTNHLDLTHEFPELKDKIHELKSSDNHFKRLYEEYGELSKAIYRSEQRIELLSEIDEEVLRKKRLALKDQLYSTLKK